MSEDKKSELIKLCGLWEGQAADGNMYLSGQLSYSSRVIIFKNKYQEDNDKAPDYIMYIQPCVRQDEKPEATKKGKGKDNIPF